jgi:ABC-type sugar transport system ATPase subunit
LTTLRIDRVSKNFGGVAAVSDISMQVPPGVITGLIGPNGAGKTTLINLITGISTVSGGSIHFGAQDITQAPAHMVARAGITRTFQNIRLLAEASVIDNVMIGFYRRESTPAWASLLGPAFRAARDAQPARACDGAAAAFRHGRPGRARGRRPGLWPPAARRDDACAGVRSGADPARRTGGRHERRRGRRTRRHLRRPGAPRAWACC